MPSLFLGVAGGTGSGKTTITRAIASGLPPASVVTVEHDAYSQRSLLRRGMSSQNQMVEFNPVVWPECFELLGALHAYSRAVAL